MAMLNNQMVKQDSKVQGAACSEDVAEGQGPEGRVAPRRATVNGQTLGIGQTCGPERLELVSSMGPIYVIYIYIYIYDYICHMIIYDICVFYLPIILI